MTIIHKDKQYDVKVQPTQSGQPDILFYECEGKQYTQDMFEAMVNGSRKKKETDYYELKYNGKVEAAGPWIVCNLKKKELMKSGSHQKGTFKIE